MCILNLLFLDNTNAFEGTNFNLGFCFFSSLDRPGFARASYLHSKMKNKGICKGFWRGEKRFRQATRRMIKTQFFYWMVILLVFLNTACVSIEHYGQERWLTDLFCKLPGVRLLVADLIRSLFPTAPQTTPSSSSSAYSSAKCCSNCMQSVRVSTSARRSTGSIAPSSAAPCSR